jgi:hypothetical protein
VPSASKVTMKHWCVCSDKVFRGKQKRNLRLSEWRCWQSVSSRPWRRFLVFIVSQDLSAFATILLNVVTFYQSTRRNVSEDSNIQEAANLFPFCVSVGEFNVFSGFSTTTRHYSQEYWSSEWGHVWDVTHNCLWSKPACLYAWLSSFLVQFWETVLCSPVACKILYTSRWLPPSKTENICLICALKELSLSVSRISLTL